MAIDTEYGKDLGEEKGRTYEPLPLLKPKSSPINPKDLGELPMDTFVQIVSAMSTTSSRVEEIEKWIGEQIFRQKNEPKHEEIIQELRVDNEILQTKVGKLRDILLAMTHDDTRIGSGWRTIIATTVKEVDDIKRSKKS